MTLYGAPAGILLLMVENPTLKGPEIFTARNLKDPHTVKNSAAIKPTYSVNYS